NQALIYQVAKYYDDDGQEYISAFAFDKFVKLNIQSPALEYAKRRLLELKQKLKVYPNPEESLRHYPRGTMIFSEFQTGAEMYVIQSGSVKISKVLNGTEVTLAVLKPGQMFGEMALLNNDLRSASAITVEDSEIRAINMANFQKITESSPDMITNLTKTFAERLWIMQRQLINSRLRDDPVAKMIDILALQLEKMNYTENTSVEYQTEFSPNDIATMCGLTKSEQSRCMFNFMNFRFIETKKNKIFVSDCSEVIKQAAFYRKKLLRNQ
ncbi:MAG: Crp/Fnr family transcriptional regulator, partial [Treponema sp.]|nr:Crp/Fnr family transcriptional regulator [Treponema sp.]